MEDKQETTAILTDYTEHYDSDKGTMWTGVYEFEVDGEKYEAVSSLSTSARRTIKKSVKIEYDKADPYINVIASERLFPITFIAFVSLFTVVGFRMAISPVSVNTRDDYEVNEHFF